MFTRRLPEQPADQLMLNWRQLPNLPTPLQAFSALIPTDAPWWQAIGLGGPIVGVHGDYLLVGGGSNFPEPGRTVSRANTLGKVYWNDLFVMQLEQQKWIERRYTLPQAIAYAAAVSLPEGILVIGGEGFDAPNGTANSPAQLFKHVFLLQIDPRDLKLTVTFYPALPDAISYASATHIDRQVYVHHGNALYCLHLDALERGWLKLAEPPGGMRICSLCASIGAQIIVASGRPANTDVIYRDCYLYQPSTDQWSRLSEMPLGAMAGLSFGVQERYFVVMGGDGNVARWRQLRDLINARQVAAHHSAAWHEANDALTFLYDHHSGFNRAIQVYDYHTQRWLHGGYLPCAAPVTTIGVQWRDELLLVSGEVAPGKRTAEIWAARLDSAAI